MEESSPHNYVIVSISTSLFFPIDKLISPESIDLDSIGVQKKAIKLNRELPVLVNKDIHDGLNKISW